MPISYTVDHGLRRVLVIAIGEIRLEDMAAIMSEIGAQQGLAYAIRFDARAAALMLSAEETRRLVPLIARLREEHGRGRTAFVTESDVSFGMARMYATLAAESDPDFMVYRTLADGDAWLGWERAESAQPSR